MKHSEEKQVRDYRPSEKAAIESSLALTIEAQDHGLSALNNLEIQEENIEDATDTLEANEYTLAKSMRVLRGMTWSGSIYNMFSSDQPVAKQKSQSSSSVQVETLSTAPGTLESSKSWSSSGAQSSSSSSSLSSAPLVLDPVDEVLKGVERLHDMSLILGDRIQRNTAKLTDHEAVLASNEDAMLQVTLRTAQLTQRSVNSVETLIGTFNFISRSSNMYLTVSDADELAMTALDKCEDGGAVTDRAGIFFVYKKQEHLFGLQSAKTCKWLGTTWLGDIKVSGDRFGRNEEVYVDLTGRSSGVFVLACNWYGGGWMKAPPSGGVAAMVRPTSGVDDKNDIVLLEAIPWGDTFKHAKRAKRNVGGSTTT